MIAIDESWCKQVANLGKVYRQCALVRLREPQIGTHFDAISARMKVCLSRVHYQRSRQAKRVHRLAIATARSMNARANASDKRN